MITAFARQVISEDKKYNSVQIYLFFSCKTALLMVTENSCTCSRYNNKQHTPDYVRAYITVRHTQHHPVECSTG